MSYERFKWETTGLALSENTVVLDKVRFTILTSRMIRIEYSENQSFENRASQLAFYRDFPKCVFTKTEQDGWLSLETEHLIINYRIGQPLNKENFNIELKIKPFSKWCYGDIAPQLKGTACTLDNINGAIELEDGICSRNGFTVIDDTSSLLLTQDGWFDVRKEGNIDIYFFGYGHSYLECISDFYRLTGKPPMLPDYAFGNWWSRYHKYTQQSYLELMEQFKNKNIPFSVAVIDMDWHRLLSVLDDREKEVVIRHLLNGEKQNEISEEFNVTFSRVNQIYWEALDKILRYI